MRFMRFCVFAPKHKGNSTHRYNGPLCHLQISKHCTVLTYKCNTRSTQHITIVTLLPCVKTPWLSGVASSLLVPPPPSLFLILAGFPLFATSLQEETAAFFLGVTPRLTAEDAVFNRAWDQRCRLVTLPAGTVWIQMNVLFRNLQDQDMNAFPFS